MRRLTNNEIAALVERHAGITAAQFNATTSNPELVACEDGLQLLEWNYSQRLKFLLLAADYPTQH
jgi:hypothetical protein